jgi:plasmid stability protein
MTSISLKLPDELNSRLRAAARRRGEPCSAVVRDALQTYLDAADGPAAGSGLDLIADLVGCVKGPGDLSSNPKHLRGYGK